METQQVASNFDLSLQNAEINIPFVQPEIMQADIQYKKIASVNVDTKLITTSASTITFNTPAASINWAQSYVYFKLADVVVANTANHSLTRISQMAPFSALEYIVNGTSVEQQSDLQYYQRSVAPLFYDQMKMDDCEFYYTKAQADNGISSFIKPTNQIAATAYTGVAEYNQEIKPDHIGQQCFTKPINTGVVYTVTCKVPLKYLLWHSLFSIDDFVYYPAGSLELTLTEKINIRQLGTALQPIGDWTMSEIKLILCTTNQKLPPIQRFPVQKCHMKGQLQSNATIGIQRKWKYINHLIFGIFNNAATDDSNILGKWFGGLITDAGVGELSGLTLTLNHNVVDNVNSNSPEFRAFIANNVNTSDFKNFLRSSNSFMVDFKKNNMIGQPTESLLSDPYIIFAHTTAGASAYLFYCEVYQAQLVSDRINGTVVII